MPPAAAMEWHLQLPVHHYIHVVSGIAEFATLTTAAVLAMRRTRRDGDPRVPSLRRGGHGRWPSAIRCSGLVYLTDRLGTLVEPVFFVAFSVMVLAEVFEPIAPIGSRRAGPSGWRSRGTGAAPQPTARAGAVDGPTRIRAS